MHQKLCLGTAQLGLDYGVANQSGKPDIETAFSILDHAWGYGVRVFDTAALYGDSERIVGQWIRSRGNAAEVKIVTKLPLMPDYEGRALTDWIIHTGREQRMTLGVTRLMGLLLHRGGDLFRPGVKTGLEALVAEGVCQHIGLSAYHPEEAELGLKAGLDVFQVPYNLLDRRFDDCGWMQEAKEKGVWVFARSPFLQGLLLMASDRIPGHLSFGNDVISKIHRVLQAHGYSPLEGALQFALRHPSIDYVVLGVESIEQLDQIICAAKKDVPVKLLDKVTNEIGEVEERLILPYLWGK